MKKIVLLLSIVVMVTSCSKDDNQVRDFSPESVKITMSSKTDLDVYDFTNAYYLDFLNTLNFPVYVEFTIDYTTLDNNQTRKEVRETRKEQFNIKPELEYPLYQNADTKIRVNKLTIIKVQRILNY